MLKFNTNFMLICCLLLATTFAKAQVEIEHLSTVSSPTLLLEDTAMNNFTRLFFGNTETDKQWRFASRAFTTGLETNKFDINYYDGSSAINYLSFNADDLKIYANEDVQIRKRLHVSSNPVLALFTQAEFYTDTENYATYSHNETESNLTTFGSFTWATGPGDGDRYGASGNGQADSGDAYGVKGQASSQSGNEYGVYGEASGPAGTSWAIYGNGNIYYTGSFSAPSDKRLKKNIKKMQNGVLDKLMELDVQTYEYDHDKYPSLNFAKGSQIGFLAQDLQVLFPETVLEQTHIVYEVPGDEKSQKSKIDILGVDYIKIIPVLTQAIQEQNTLIEKIQTENKSLRLELDEIHKILADLKK